jgi:hypothetical protein
MKKMYDHSLREIYGSILLGVGLGLVAGLLLKYVGEWLEK